MLAAEADCDVTGRNRLPRYTLEWCDSLPKFDRGVSLVCWAYNEEELIEAFLRRARHLLGKYVEDYEIVVVDDCSTDRTNEIVTRLAEEIPQIRLIRNPVNLNVGLSSQKAIMSAEKEFVFWQTIDWSYDILCLRAFLELLKSYDVVAGVRRAPVEVVDQLRLIKPLLGVLKLFGINHITHRSDSIGKALVSVVNYILIRALFRVPLSDFQNVVFYPTELIQSIELESRSSFANPEALLKAYWRGASTIEVPISFLPRRRGVAKGTRFSAIKNSVGDILCLWFRWIVLGKQERRERGAIRRLNPSEWEHL
jgi:glycosyltransferase involved in cell wall biosynthesis